MARPSDGRWQRGHGVEQDWLPKRTLVGSNVAVLQTQTRSVSQGRGKGKLRYEGQASQTRAPVRPGRRCCLLLWVLRGFYQRPDGAKILFPLPFILSPMIRPPPLLIDRQSDAVPSCGSSSPSRRAHLEAFFACLAAWRLCARLPSPGYVCCHSREDRRSPCTGTWLTTRSVRSSSMPVSS